MVTTFAPHYPHSRWKDTPSTLLASHDIPRILECDTFTTTKWFVLKIRFCSPNITTRYAFWNNGRKLIHPYVSSSETYLWDPELDVVPFSTRFGVESFLSQTKFDEGQSVLARVRWKGLLVSGKYSRFTNMSQLFEARGELIGCWLASPLVHPFPALFPPFSIHLL